MGRRKDVCYEVTMILPEDTTELEKKYAQVMADIVTKQLTPEELKVFIERFEELYKDEL